MRRQDLNPVEVVNFIRHLESLLKRLLNVSDVEIIVTTDEPESIFGDAADESLLEAPSQGSTDRKAG